MRAPRHLGLVALGLLLLPLLLIAVAWAVDRVGRDERAVRVVVADDAGPPPAAPERALRVGTYNIAHGRGAEADSSNFAPADEKRRRLDEIGRFLAAQDLDVVVLNEVDFDAVWSPANQAEHVARVAGFAYRVEQRNVDAGLFGFGLRFGNALLSRYPLEGCVLLDYPAYRRLEAALAGKKRGVACDLALGDERARVAAVHLSHRSEATRLASAAYLHGLARAGGPPVILAGDFNSTLPSFPEARPVNGVTALSWLLERGFETRLGHPEEHLSFPSQRPTRAIDWVLVTPPAEVLEQRVLAAPFSDHLPVVAEVALR